MKKLMMILIIAIGVSSIAYGQTKMSKDSNEAQIIALEKASWEAWKNKDAKWYQTNTIDEAMWINSESATGKTQVIKDLATCDMKSYSLDNFNFVMLSKDVASLNYTAMQDAVCNGKKIPSQVRAIVNYVKRGGKWLEGMYMETPMTQ